MKKILAGIVFLCLLAMTIGAAFPLPQKSEASATTDGWLKSGGNLFNQNYSPLAQINRQSVAGLKAVWRARLDGSGMNPKYSVEAAPVLNQGVVYIVTGADDVFAISVQTRKTICKDQP